MKKHTASNTCPCVARGKDTKYAQCCQPYIENRKLPSTAEQLMRSRYTAYVLGDAAYLLATWHPDTRPAHLDLDTPDTPHATKWLGLTVHSHTQLTDTQAQVLFTARYKEGGRAHRLTEHSKFLREDGRWFYLGGEVNSDASAPPIHEPESQGPAPFRDSD